MAETSKKDTITAIEALWGDASKRRDKFYILGLGQAYGASGKNGKTHTIKVDVNKTAVEKSFDSFTTKFKKQLFYALNTFYTNDKNKYKGLKNGSTFNKGISENSITFKINAIQSRKDSTTFTYVYQFHLTYNDPQGFTVEAVDFLEKLQETLPLFKEHIISKFNQLISSEGIKRDESELNISSVISLCDEISDVHLNAPVLSSQSRKFDLSQMDLEELTKNVLFKRAQKQDASMDDKTYNAVVLDHYCKGQNDYQIATELYFDKLWNKLKYDPDFANQIKKGVISSILYAYAWPVGVANDIMTYLTGNDLLKTKSWSDSICGGETPKTIGGMMLSDVEDATNRGLALIDLISTTIQKVFNGPGIPQMSGISFFWQASHCLLETLHNERRETGIKSLMEVPLTHMIINKIFKIDLSITKDIIITNKKGEDQVLDFSKQKIETPSLTSEFHNKTRKWHGVQKNK